MRDRTADLLNANQALSQLSYSPILACLFKLILRCACRSLSYVHKYMPSLSLARALSELKNSTSNIFDVS